MSRDHSQNHYGPNASFDGYDSDLASAGILIESLRQQLTAAMAACKLKDRALSKLQRDTGLVVLMRPDQVETIANALLVQPDDSAIKEGFDQAWCRDPDQ